MINCPKTELENCSLNFYQFAISSTISRDKMPAPYRLRLTTRHCIKIKNASLFNIKLQYRRIRVARDKTVRATPALNSARAKGSKSRARKTYIRQKVARLIFHLRDRARSPRRLLRHDERGIAVSCSRRCPRGRSPLRPLFAREGFYRGS